MKSRNRKITKKDLIRLALLLGAVAVILFVLPRADKKTYSYTLNAPWIHPLLTAEVNFPIYPDSTSTRKLQDSIERNFLPFVYLDSDVKEQNITRFIKSIENNVSSSERSVIEKELRKVYDRGIVDAATYDHLRKQSTPKLRMFTDKDGTNTAETIAAGMMLSPSKAYEYIDSVYNAFKGLDVDRPLEGDLAKVVNVCLTPNYISDSETDRKFLDEELLVAKGAFGMVLAGQRIVDRGEIVTPQVYTNLNTYFEELAKANIEKKETESYHFVGQGLYVLIWLLTLYFFLGTYRKQFFDDTKKMIFLMSFITLFVVFAVLMSGFSINGLYLVPFAAVPVIVLIFLDSRTAIFALLVTVMISALVTDQTLTFIFLEMTAGLVAAFSIHQLSQRSQLLRTAFFTLLSYVVGYLVMQLIAEGEIAHIQWRMLGIFSINAVILSFAYILILIVERIFGFTSTVTLVELSDINNKLLRKLAEDAPGTFQHSMQVSTLASEAARAIGANTQLVRTGALYHDIGKMESPVFFTENQHGINPHEGLNPETSAQKIISHVTGGLTLANKWKLPKVIRDFISEHHGKSVTRYFYNTAKNNNPDGEVDRSLFQYPGPNPQSKETAILMMADAVEAASRSLKDYTPEAINALVDKIVDGQAADGLFKEAPISYRDVEKVKDTFKKRLATIYHSRIAYPELHKDVKGAV
ncbi:MAG: HDIG domain-containing protein [Muribaculaceae bacterium]|nr:HDIG domain-containing protein [Muribaculaceae bacterium]